MSSIGPVPANRPWWSRNANKASDSSLPSSSKLPSTLKTKRSLSSVKYDDDSGRSDSSKHKRNNVPPSKFNTLASAIGLKSKKNLGPSLAIQDPPSPLSPDFLVPLASPLTPATSQGSHNQSPRQSQPPTASSTVRSWDDVEELRTPSDIGHRDRSSHHRSVMTLNDDPFAAQSIVLPPQLQDPLRLSVFSDHSNYSGESYQKKGGGASEYSQQRQSYASASSSSQSHGHSHRTSSQIDEPLSAGFSSSLYPESPDWQPHVNRLSEPPYDPIRHPHRPPMRARGMTDVGPRRVPSFGQMVGFASVNASSVNLGAGGSASNPSKPLVVVRQASGPRFRTGPTGPPPPVPIPPPPMAVTSDAVLDISHGKEKTKDSQSAAVGTSSPQQRLSICDDPVLGVSEEMSSHFPASSFEDDDDSGSASSLSFASAGSGHEDEVGDSSVGWNARHRGFKRHVSSKSRAEHRVSLRSHKGKEKARDEEEWDLMEMINMTKRLSPHPHQQHYNNNLSGELQGRNLKKAVSQQNIATAFSNQRYSVASSASAHSVASTPGEREDALSRNLGDRAEKSDKKAPRKQRSFHHPRIPLPPIPLPLRNNNSHHTAAGSSSASSYLSHTQSSADSPVSTVAERRVSSTNFMFPSFPSLSISTTFGSGATTSAKSEKNSMSSEGRPQTPVRKRLFSGGSNGKRRSSGEAQPSKDEDGRSVFSLPEGDGKRVSSLPFSPNDSTMSFWEEVECAAADDSNGKTSKGSRMSGSGQGDYVPQQIMSPAEMLKVEAMLEEQDRASQHSGHSHRDSMFSMATMSASDHGLLAEERGGSADLSGGSPGRARGSSFASSMSTSTHMSGASTGSRKGVISVGRSAQDEDRTTLGSPTPSSRLWDRSSRGSHDPHVSLSTHLQKQLTNASNMPAVSSPLSPHSQSTRVQRSASVFARGLSPPVARQRRPSTSQSQSSPPASPTLGSYGSGQSSTTLPYGSGLPPPPRRRPRNVPGNSSTLMNEGISKRLSTAHVHALSPPPRRRGKTLVSGPPPTAMPQEDQLHRRSLMRKPSFLDIEDHDEISSGEQTESEDVRPLRPFDDNFLDLGRGKDSFDTVRSMDVVEIGGPS